MTAEQSNPNGNMHDRTGWERIDCAASDARRERAVGVSSSLTDPEGTYGPGVVYTEWCDENDRPVLRDYRWSDDRQCDHLIPNAEASR